MSDRITIRRLIESERQCTEQRLNDLGETRIGEAFDLLLSLFHELLDEAENYSSGSPYSGGAVVVNGGLVPSWELKLWVHMFAGSFVQFTIAISHILRGQASEAYGHVRRAIENSGIAFLSKTEPKIVDFYKAGREYDMAKEYPKSRLFPLSNDVTCKLNRMMSLASRHLHGNRYSNSLSIIEEGSVDEGSRVLSTVTFSWQDQMTFPELWEVCYFVLAAGYYVLRLYETTFELPKGDWHKKLSAFKEDLDSSDLKVQAAFDKSSS